jgi:hypothetical protein
VTASEMGAAAGCGSGISDAMIAVRLFALRKVLQLAVS